MRCFTVLIFIFVFYCISTFASLAVFIICFICNEFWSFCNFDLLLIFYWCHPILRTFNFLLLIYLCYSFVDDFPFLIRFLVLNSVSAHQRSYYKIVLAVLLRFRYFSDIIIITVIIVFILIRSGFLKEICVQLRINEELIKLFWRQSLRVDS
jgi:hypothetical protein